jgi:hypothetical protein
MKDKRKWMIFIRVWSVKIKLNYEKLILKYQLLNLFEYANLLIEAMEIVK